MELSQLKVVWKEVANEEEASAQNKEQILNMQDSPSQTLVSKMRRNLFYELLIVLVSVIGIAVFYFISFGGKLQEVSWAYILLALVFIGYYYKKDSLLKAMHCSTCSVKVNLELQLKSLEKYVRLYLIAGTTMAPLVMLFYYKHIVIFPYALAGKTVYEFAMLYLMFTSILTFIFYFFNRWYINRLYGRHIQKLRSLLCEMEEQ